MAFRRRLGNLADMLLKSHLASNEADHENQLIEERQKQLAEQNSANSILQHAIQSPAFANRLGRSNEGARVGNLPAEMFGSTSSDYLAVPTKEIAGAKTPEELGTLRGRFEQYRQGVVGDDTPGGVSLNDIQNLGDTFNAQNKQIGLNEEAAADRKAAGEFNTAYQTNMGTNKAANENLPDLIKRINEQNAGTETSIGHSQFVQSMNQAKGQATGADPFTEGQLLYDQDGNPHWMKLSNGRVVDTPLPPGYAEPSEINATKPQRLAAGQVDQLASLNTAETEGVKVLAALHATGLDQSNDMLDPRWNKFAVQTLKIAPEDWEHADIQQRAAFVKASILRAMMGGRPSQYIAEIYNEHVPDGAMTGQQLYHVTNNVLEQVGSRRNEMEHLTNNEPDAFRPTSGMTYQDWLKTAGPVNPVNPGPGQQGDPDIQEFMKRAPR